MQMTWSGRPEERRKSQASSLKAMDASAGCIDDLGVDCRQGKSLLNSYSALLVLRHELLLWESTNALVLDHK